MTEIQQRMQLKKLLCNFNNFQLGFQFSAYTFCAELYLILSLCCLPLPLAPEQIEWSIKKEYELKTLATVRLSFDDFLRRPLSSPLPKQS